MVSWIASQSAISTPAARKGWQALRNNSVEVAEGIGGYLGYYTNSVHTLVFFFNTDIIPKLLTNEYRRLMGVISDYTQVHSNQLAGLKAAYWSTWL